MEESQRVVIPTPSLFLAFGRRRQWSWHSHLAGRSLFEETSFCPRWIWGYGQNDTMGNSMWQQQRQLAWGEEGQGTGMLVCMGVVVYASDLRTVSGGGGGGLQTVVCFGLDDAKEWEISWFIFTCVWMRYKVYFIKYKQLTTMSVPLNVSVRYIAIECAPYTLLIPKV